MMEANYPMLAVPADIDGLGDSEYLAQPKLNGIRAIWNPASGELLTRNGNTIKSADHIVDQIKGWNLDGFALDGELYTNRISFQELNGLCRRQSTSEETMILEYHVFDMAVDGVDLEDRMALVNNIGETSHIKKVGFDSPENHDEIRALYKTYLGQGYEGIILRKKGSYYSHGRTSDLLKIKPVLDMEAQLIGFAPAKEDDSKNKDTFGSLILRLSNGVGFYCGGISDTARQELWDKKPLGAMVNFKYGAMSDNGTPVFPRYSYIRWDTEAI